jgi:hypothetical protein
MAMEEVLSLTETDAPHGEARNRKLWKNGHRKTPKPHGDGMEKTSKDRRR